MRKLKQWLLVLVVCWLAGVHPAWAAPAKTTLTFEAGFETQQDLTVWPLEIARGYPLVRAQVGEVLGVFILDTGTPWGLLLNSGRIRLADATWVLGGRAGSGQPLVVYRASQMPSLQIHGQSWTQVRNVHSADLSFVEQGTGLGPFLGFIGANFLKNTALTLDYARRVALVQRLHPDSGAPLVALPAAQSGGTPLTSVSYRAEQPNLPQFDASLSGKPVRVMLDSGNSGVSVDLRWLAELQATGAAQAFSLIGDKPSFQLPALKIGNLEVPLLDVTPFQTSSATDGQTAPPLIKIGFGLLKHLGVTWNYRLQTMTFFTP